MPCPTPTRMFGNWCSRRPRSRQSCLWKIFSNETMVVSLPPRMSFGKSFRCSSHRRPILFPSRLFRSRLPRKAQKSQMVHGRKWCYWLWITQKFCHDGYRKYYYHRYGHYWKIKPQPTISLQIMGCRQAQGKYPVPLTDSDGLVHRLLIFAPF